MVGEKTKRQIRGPFSTGINDRVKETGVNESSGLRPVR